MWWWLASALASEPHEPQVTVAAWDQVVLNHTPSGLCLFVLRFEPQHLAQVSVIACHQDHLNRALALIEQAEFEAPAGEHVLELHFQAPRPPPTSASPRPSAPTRRVRATTGCASTRTSAPS